MFEVTQFYYDPDRNKMMDCNGFIVFDIFRYVRPAMLHVFLHDKEYKCFEVSKNSFVELIYPEEEYLEY